MAEFPKNLKYSRDHEWVSFDGCNATIGITSFACEQLGDIVYVDLPNSNGEFIKAGQPIGAVESTKAASDVFCPVSGKIIETNSSLSDNPEILNQDPYSQGWLARLEISDESELQNLMDYEQYQQHLHSVEH